MKRIDLEAANITAGWINLLDHLYNFGTRSAPRGKPIREICGVSLHITDGYANILESERRNLNYRFMVAEWLWIWFAHTDVATIARYNKHIAQFSDDGVTFNGAYGAPISAQWSRVVDTLRADPDSRQAVIQIYSPPRGPTKDVPCTISLQFLFRGRLDLIVTMRSSDVWLGLPYDFFTFSMLANIMAGQLGYEVGSVLMNLGSSHLYEVNADDAHKILLTHEGIDPRDALRSPQVEGIPPLWLDESLTKREPVCQNLGMMLRPWVDYERVLCAPKMVEAYAALKDLRPLR